MPLRIQRTVYPEYPASDYTSWMVYIRSENDKIHLGTVSAPLCQAYQKANESAGSDTDLTALYTPPP